MIGLDQQATIFLPNDTTGEYTVLDAMISCRLALVSADTARDAAERAELASTRRLLWAPEYDMPETAQIEVDGVRWNTVAGSFAAVRGPISALVYRRADVMRALA